MLAIFRNNIRLLRGNLCGICVAPNDFGIFFDNKNRLKISSKDANSYLKETRSIIENIKQISNQIKSEMWGYFGRYADLFNCAGILEKYF